MTLQDIQQLEDFFAQAGKQEVPIFLNEATVITDYDYFLESHFTPLKQNPDAKVSQPIIYRLKLLKLLIEANA
ncbi:DUF6965 family protein [Pedobacter sandarakinus]|uniref:DUF6965 family protein n=1 Tax=Pedobacter sandarakinus TaxID=353156 RepID=UPI002246376B|nr:hypothetical protein [Pedobacter sandarakinus]MCX2574915.1 hypothetical protein [Pedobacter sandarakinus]